MMDFLQIAEQESEVAEPLDDTRDSELQDIADVKKEADIEESKTLIKLSATNAIPISLTESQFMEEA